MTNTLISILGPDLNLLVLTLKEHPDLSPLPPASWQVCTSVTEGTLAIEVLLNTQLLIRQGLVSAADAEEWLWLIVPAVAKILTDHESAVPLSLAATFTVISETMTWRSSASADVLIAAVKNGRIDSFGSMMTTLDHDSEKRE